MADRVIFFEASWARGYPEWVLLAFSFVVGGGGARPVSVVFSGVSFSGSAEEGGRWLTGRRYRVSGFGVVVR